MKNFPQVLLLLIFFVISCGDGDLENDSNYEWKIIEVKIDTVGILGTNSKAFFSNPGFLVTDSKNRIIVADQGRSKLLVFKPNGQFLYSIGERGPGPAQFRYIEGIGINENDEILVFDRSSQSIKKFKSTGKYLNSYIPETTINSSVEFEQFNNLNFLFYCNYRPNAAANKLLHIFSSKYTLRGSYVSVQEFKELDQISLAFLGSDTGSHFIYENYLYFAPKPYNGVIYKYLITKTSGNDLSLKLLKTYSGLTHKIPIERFEGEHLRYADATLTLRGGKEYQFLIHNISKGLFKLDDGRIVHFTFIENKDGTKRTFGVEVYDRQMKPIGYAPIKTIRLDLNKPSNIIAWEVAWMDNKDRFYIIDRSGMPKIVVIKLKIDNDEI